MPTPDLDAVVAAGRQAIADAPDLDALREAEQAHPSRRSPLGEVQRSLGGRDEAARRDLGRRVNQASDFLQAELAARREALEAERDQALLEAERVDVTLPRPGPAFQGAIHPIARTTTRSSTSSSASATGSPRGRRSRPTAQLPGPQHLPRPPGPVHAGQPLPRGGRRARGGRAGVLRTQTSPVQIRPCRPGRRRCTSSPPAAATGPTPPTPPTQVFNQVEVLAVDRGLTMADMKGTLLAFARAYFGEEREIRLRPSYFPFVEPRSTSPAHLRRHRRGPSDLPRRGLDRAARRRQVHPNVLRAGGYDPEEVSLRCRDRHRVPYMLRSGLADMRTLTDNDVRWLTS